MPFILYPTQLQLHKTLPPDPGHLPPPVPRANINCKVQCEIDSKGCAFTGKLLQRIPFTFNATEL